MTTTSQHPSAASARRRALLRRWLPRLGLFLLAVLVLVIITVQIVLWTSLPQDLVLGQIQRQLGLRATCSSLSTGWFGRTQLRDVKLALPLAEESFLDVPVMRVRHAWLASLLVGRPVGLKGIELEKPTLYLRQDEAGTWNLNEVAELLARAGGKKAAEESTRESSSPQIPSVDLRDGSVVVIDRVGRQTTIEALQLHGAPQTPLVWRYDAKAPSPSGGEPRVSLAGELVPGPPWRHQVKIAIRDVGPWMRPWLRPWAAERADTLKFAGTWQGQVQDGQATGRMVIDDASIAGYSAKGSITARDENGATALRPQDLAVFPTEGGGLDARLVAGSVLVDTKGVRAQRLQCMALGGQAQVDGRYDFATSAADVSANWEDLLLPGEAPVTHSGKLSATIRLPFANRPEIDAQLDSWGVMNSTGLLSSALNPRDSEFPEGWRSTFVLKGRGRGWKDIDWTLDAPQLAWGGKHRVSFAGLHGVLETRGPSLALKRLDRPGDPTVQGVGEYNFETRKWYLWMADRDLPIPLLDGETFSFMLGANGDRTLANLDQLDLTGSEAHLWSRGQYVYLVPKPVDLKVWLKHTPPSMTPGRPSLRGVVDGNLTFKGTLKKPRKLDLEGEFNGHDVVVFDRPVGDIAAKLTGYIDDNQGYIKTEKLLVLGGDWSVRAMYPGQRGALGAEVKVQELPLQEVGQFLHRQDINGTLDGKWNFRIPNFKIERVSVTDSWIKARDVRGPGLIADSVTASISMAQGVVTLDPIVLDRKIRRGDTDAYGKAQARLTVNAKDLRHLSAGVTLTDWPIELSNGCRVEVFGGSRAMEISLPDRDNPDPSRRLFRAIGPIEVTSANVSLAGKPAGSGNLFADLQGRRLDLRSFKVDALDGTMQGYALVDLDKPLEAKASLQWDNVTTERLSQYFPSAADVGGVFSGTARIEPTSDPRPLEPLSIEINLHSEGGHYRTLPIGSARIKGYTNLTRLVLDDLEQSPNTIQVAGGLVRVWGRISRHPLGSGESALSSQMLARFAGLRLDDLVHAADPKSGPIPGDLSGSITLMGTTRGASAQEFDPSAPGAGHTATFLERVVRALTMEGNIHLDNADLANVDFVSVLYNAMSVGADVRKPTGSGDVTLRMEDGTLQLSDLRYFNRGTEIRAIIKVADVWKIPDSPIRGTAVGAARPLRDAKVAVLDDVDKVFSVLQGYVTSVRIEGTLRHRVISLLTFQQIGDDMRRFLLGDVKAETKGR